MKKAEKAPLVDPKDADQVTLANPKANTSKFGWITGVLVCDVSCIVVYNIWFDSLSVAAFSCDISVNTAVIVASVIRL